MILPDCWVGIQLSCGTLLLLSTQEGEKVRTHWIRCGESTRPISFVDLSNSRVSVQPAEIMYIYDSTPDTRLVERAITQHLKEEHGE